MRTNSATYPFCICYRILKIVRDSKALIRDLNNYPLPASNALPPTYVGCVWVSDKWLSEETATLPPSLGDGDPLRPESVWVGNHNHIISVKYVFTKIPHHDLMVSYIMRRMTNI